MQVVINHLLPSPHKLQIHQRRPILAEMKEKETNITRIGIGGGGEVTIASKRSSGCKGMKEIYEYISN
jgi:hypothetical protein